MKKVIDAFLLFNELDMLEFHLHAMNDSVDYFVIGECTETFAGNSKELLFDLNRDRFSKFADKIIHVTIEDSAASATAWEREEFQRDALLRGITTIPNLKNSDIILVSDVDEIVDENLLNTIEPILTNTVYALEQDIYYYNLNSRFREKQCFTRLCNVGLAKKHGFQHIRFRMRARILRPGGWHFSYFGNPASIATKIQNFSHQDLNLPHIIDENRIQHVINNGTDLFGRNQKKPEKYQIDHISTTDNDYLPKHHHMLIDCEKWQLNKPKG
jgi:beta-1,4-mannosyl-glycoprotein beta-1,4-N-acetylglucosaminyltransferase